MPPLTLPFLADAAPDAPASQRIIIETLRPDRSFVLIEMKAEAGAAKDPAASIEEEAALASALVAGYLMYRDREKGADGQRAKTAASSS